MSEPTVIKTEADVYFAHAEHKTPFFGPFPAVIQLVEHAFGPMRVWYGLADIACSNDELNSRSAESGVPRPLPGTIYSFWNFRARVELADGRWGFAKVWGGKSEESQGDQSLVVGLLCESDLTPKPA